MSADLPTLVKRLRDVLAWGDATLTEDASADVIKSNMLEQCVCARIGERIATFAQYHAAVWGRDIDGNGPKPTKRGA